MTGRALLLAALAVAACDRTAPVQAPDVLTVSVEQQASWVRNFNPLSPAGSARWPTQAGVYEPLMVFNSVRGEYVPWLALSSEWREGHLALRFNLRPGVRWSDGAPFTAKDVAFTFDLLKRFPALDKNGVWRFLAGVRALDEMTVELSFARRFIPGLDDIAPQPIVPEHLWRDVPDPVTFANPTPVATGPFTEVLAFEHQVFELGRNPHYWQPGKPALRALRFPAYPSNERANLALAFGEAEWAANFVPAINRVFVQRAPAHHRYWFPLTGSSIFLYLNTARAPFADVRVRKALSLGVDRQLLVDVALHAYSRPADATGLSDAYATWRSEAAVREGDWVRHDVDRANALLDDAGLPRGPDGMRRLRFQVLAVAGWSDWVRAAQVISRSLRQLGIDASVRTYDFSAWFERLQKGDYDASLGWSLEGPTPYNFYRALMGSGTVKPLGEAAQENWHRFGSTEADALLAAFEAEAEPARQRALSDALQQLFVAQAPALPLYPNPSWAEYSTRRVQGFPSAQDPYADPSPNKFARGECLLVLTALTPRTGP